MKKLILIFLFLITKNKLKTKQNIFENNFFNTITESILDRFDLQNENINKKNLTEAIQKVFETTLNYRRQIKEKKKRLKLKTMLPS